MTQYFAYFSSVHVRAIWLPCMVSVHVHCMAIFWGRPWAFMSAVCTPNRALSMSSCMDLRLAVRWGAFCEFFKSVNTFVQGTFVLG